MKWQGSFPLVISELSCLCYIVVRSGESGNFSFRIEICKEGSWSGECMWQGPAKWGRVMFCACWGNHLVSLTLCMPVLCFLVLSDFSELNSREGKRKQEVKH